MQLRGIFVWSLASVLSFPIVSFMLNQMSLSIHEQNCYVFSVAFNDSVASSGIGSGAKVYAHHMVRTDSREQTLHAFVPPKDHGIAGKPCHR